LEIDRNHPSKPQPEDSRSPFSFLQSIRLVKNSLIGWGWLRQTYVLWIRQVNMQEILKPFHF